MAHWTLLQFIERKIITELGGSGGTDGGKNSRRAMEKINQMDSQGHTLSENRV